MVWAPLIAAGVGAAISYGQMRQQKKLAEEQQKMAEKAMKNRPVQTASPYAQAALADAQGGRHAVSPAMINAQREAAQQQTNVMGYAQRNAGSSSQALAMGAMANQGYNNALPGLAAGADSYGQQQRGNYMQALGGMTEQDMMVQQDRNAAWADRLQYLLGRGNAHSMMRGQAQQNMWGGLMSGMNYASQMGGTWGKGNGAGVYNGGISSIPMRMP